jgi:hypothetical protein
MRMSLLSIVLSDVFALFPHFRGNRGENRKFSDLGATFSLKVKRPQDLIKPHPCPLRRERVIPSYDRQSSPRPPSSPRALLFKTLSPFRGELERGLPVKLCLTLFNYKWGDI